VVVYILEKDGVIKMEEYNERLAVVEALLKEIRDNHLPHLQGQLDNLKNWIIGSLFTACISLVVLVVNLVIQLTLR
jgi:hypothetical protein